MKILVFGGSFDPVHKGHVALLRQAIKEIAPDVTHIVPAYQSPFKAKSPTPFRLRMKMLKQAFAKTARAREEIPAIGFGQTVNEPCLVDVDLIVPADGFKRGEAKRYVFHRVPVAAAYTAHAAIWPGMVRAGCAELSLQFTKRSADEPVRFICQKERNV